MHRSADCAERDGRVPDLCNLSLTKMLRKHDAALIIFRPLNRRSQFPDG
jgi:hypothetical protein